MHLPAGTSRTIVRRQFSSVPIDYHFSAQGLGDSAAPHGTIEVHRRKLLAASPIETAPLQTENCVHAGMWDTFVTVTVHAESELVVRSTKFPGRSMMPILLVALGIAVLAGLIAFLASR